MNCAICKTSIKIYEFDLQTAFEGINPITFRKAAMHFGCFQDALDVAKETESRDKSCNFQNRYDEYITPKV